MFKQVVRARTRSLLTVAGVATAMFLFAAIQSLQAGMQEATGETAEDAKLVVFRENRFCPFTSRLPEYYESRIKTIPGVVDVIPMKVVVSNCRASLDVVTFRGVPSEHFARTEARLFRIRDGSLEDWLHRSDAALVGAELADRRRFKVGDRFEANGVTVSVAAIFDSDEPQDRNVAYVDLDFLQLAPGMNADGIVTQYLVTVDNPAQLERVAETIDLEFENDEEPTFTQSEKAFVARAAGDVVELIHFTQWVGIGCLAAMVALVANSIVLSVQERVRDYAVFQTLGYTGKLVGALIVSEGVLLSLIGGFIGTVGAIAFLSWGNFSLSNEGLSIGFGGGVQVWVSAFVISAVLGVLAGVVPAIRASRLEIAASFRAV